MDSFQTEATFETCPKCEQKTASHLFRTVKNLKLCALCAARNQRDQLANEARASDARHHGGLGWLWKHIAWVALTTVAWTILRLGIRSH